MRLDVAVGMRTHPLATSPLITLVDLWTLCGVTDPLQDGGLSGVRSSNNEHAELEIAGHAGVAFRQLGRDLTHSSATMVTRIRLVRGLNTREIGGCWGLWCDTCVSEPMYSEWPRSRLEALKHAPQRGTTRREHG
jgi:hypothetical protein